MTPARRVKDERLALQAACLAALESPCAKSKRGVAVFDRRLGLVAVGCNHPPEGFRCDGSEECRQHCNKLCVHAEADALQQVRLWHEPRGSVYGPRLEMVHVKVVDGEAVPSGHPSCWQCSRHILNFGVVAMWLLHEDGLRRYGPEEFHEHTLRNLQLPVIK